MRTAFIAVLFNFAIFFQHEGHAATPTKHALWEYLLVGFSIAVLIWVLYLAVRMTFQPGERDPDHIKRTILEERWEPPAEKKVNS